MHGQANIAAAKQAQNDVKQAPARGDLSVHRQVACKQKERAIPDGNDRGSKKIPLARNIAQKLPGLVHMLQTYHAENAISKCILRSAMVTHLTPLCILVTPKSKQMTSTLVLKHKEAYLIWHQVEVGKL